MKNSKDHLSPFSRVNFNFELSNSLLRWKLDEHMFIYIIIQNLLCFFIGSK